jgi:hypothetical protein
MESRMVKKAPRGLFCIAASQPLTSTLWERLWCWLEYSCGRVLYNRSDILEGSPGGSRSATTDDDAEI